MTLGSHSELTDLGGGQFSLEQHIKPISYQNGGAWTRITNALGASGDPVFPVGVDELAQFRIKDKLAGQSPIVHFGKGQTMVRFTPLDTNNTDGVPLGDNGWHYPEAWNNADLDLIMAGHRLQKNVVLRTGHPDSFSFRIDENAGLDPDTLETDDFRILEPMLEKDGEDSIPLEWQKATQGGKLILTVNLPVGDWSGWALDPTLILQPDGTGGKDNRLLSWVPNNNLGAGTSLSFGYSDISFQENGSLIEFDLSAIPGGATISSAVLSLYDVDASQKDVAFSADCYRILVNWLAGTQTNGIEAGASCWNYRAYNTDAWSVAGCRGSGVDHSATLMGSALIPWPGAGWRDFSLDLTEFSAMLSDNNGIMIRGRGSGDGEFCLVDSSDSITPSQRPKLTIVYTVGANPIFSTGFSQIFGGLVVR